MSYANKDFSSLLGFDGLSDLLLANHFTLYQGYVTNTNKLIEALKQLEQAEKIATPEYAELKRRLGWEWNGMRLHELYFENLSKAPTAPSAKLIDAISQEFGSFEAFQKILRGTAAMRGIGWVVLYADEANKRLFVQWVNEHDTAHLAGLKPLLVMDVFEHAYISDFGIKRADYIEVFMNHVDWQAVEGRL
jgi:Fe-Mn family superoxide dismutase